ncbi:glycosyltransferase [Luteimonas fraxinea]|uniref:Glycosyltransferase n=1 Tax=Luteimonas fraxinea TaxID=2901869 RepID=A0ABS8UG55_9GAMM|nr:glycosyltransferase [Luteimonas fraxinea]MCD9097726.1 glycosyltransferase [Luteimonas fraxinea]MCD9127562.1 glycosyltransferase [Luteimonas fraxinea]UHH08621.1 glycosyltransferase [Luteimonas fraxinea]
MIGVVIPAHNEEACIAACLASVQIAAHSDALGGEEVVIVVALDRCSDGTAAIVAACGVRSVIVHDGNVGLARAAGAAFVIGLGARWVACTDADSRVPRDWLACQLACAADAFCGIVTVDDWLDYDDTVRMHFGTAEEQRDGHPHVHGANMGFSAAMYLRCGGFPPLSAHEDVAMVDALHRAGAHIARRATPVVITSARRVARAQGGFADYLLALEARTRLLAAPLLETTVSDFGPGSDAHAA